MSVAVAPRPVPLARVRLQRVQVRGTGRPTGVPVFHVFEELFARAQHPALSARTAPDRSGPPSA